MFERGGLNIDGRDVNIDYAEDRPPSGGDRGACHFVVNCNFSTFLFLCSLVANCFGFVLTVPLKLNKYFRWRRRRRPQRRRCVH